MYGHRGSESSGGDRISRERKKGPHRRQSKKGDATKQTNYRNLSREFQQNEIVKAKQCKKTQKRRNRRNGGKPASSNQVEQEAPQRKFPRSRHPPSPLSSPFFTCKIQHEKFPLICNIKKIEENGKT